MRRVLVVAVAALCGLAVGGLVSAATSAPTVSPSPTVAAPPVEVDSVDGPGVVVAWTPGGLDPGVRAALAGIEGVVSATVVRGDLVELRRSERADGSVVDDPPGSAVIPLDALAIEPSEYARAVPVGLAKQVAGLGADEVFLGETSAALRRLGPGGQVELVDGQRYRVAAVLADDVVAGAEVVFDRDGGSEAGVVTDRYVVIVFDGDRSSLDAAIHETVTAPVRVRGPAETPFLRHGDAVLTQAEIKQRFGEFSYRPGPGDTIRPDPAWEAEHLVGTTVPLIGPVRCHRAVVDPLRAAVRQLDDDGLAHLVHADTFGGCWNPRRVATDEGLSRHAWGVAVDINVGKNPTGIHAAIDERVVDAFEDHGFTWGGRWLVPDPAHFEYRHP